MWRESVSCRKEEVKKSLLSHGWFFRIAQVFFLILLCCKNYEEKLFKDDNIGLYLEMFHLSWMSEASRLRQLLRLSRRRNILQTLLCKELWTPRIWIWRNWQCPRPRGRNSGTVWGALVSGGLPSSDLRQGGQSLRRGRRMSEVRIQSFWCWENDGGRTCK